MSCSLRIKCSSSCSISNCLICNWIKNLNFFWSWPFFLFFLLIFLFFFFISISFFWWVFLHLNFTFPSWSFFILSIESSSSISEIRRCISSRLISNWIWNKYFFRVSSKVWLWWSPFCIWPIVTFRFSLSIKSSSSITKVRRCICSRLVCYWIWNKNFFRVTIKVWLWWCPFGIWPIVSLSKRLDLSISLPITSISINTSWINICTIWFSSSSTHWYWINISC